MKSLSISLLKYFSLFLALAFTAANLLYSIPGTDNLLLIQISLGIVYVFFSVMEFTSRADTAHLPADRFFYFTLSFLSFKLIKNGAFAIACGVLFFSRSNLVFLAGLLLIVILADVLIFVLRFSRRAYFISLFANYVLFSLEDEKKIFASQVNIIEYRYRIFYLQLKSGKTYSIDVARIEKNLQASFIEKFVLWVVCNKLHFTNEAKEKLADVIAEAI
jgi:hypothetical protein